MADLIPNRPFVPKAPSPTSRFDQVMTAQLTQHLGRIATKLNQTYNRTESDAAIAALSATYQPLDSDLTAIAALSTTSFGLAFLELANAAALTALLDAATTSLPGVVELATAAEVRAHTALKYIDAALLTTAAATVALSDGATVAVDWSTGINFTLEITANRILGNPTNEIPGTFRTVLVDGSDTTDRTLTFGSEYGGTPPTIEDADSSQAYLLTIYCKAAGQFLVTSIDGSDV